MNTEKGPRTKSQRRSPVVMYSSRVALGVLVFLVLITPAWGGHTLTSQEQKFLGVWLARHPDFRVATDSDCDCAEDIQQMKKGYGGGWPAVPDYHPYVATGDFNSDGVRDFAVVVIDGSKSAQNFVLLVFNGPFDSRAATPAFVASGLDLRYQGLSFGPPRPKPYRLVMGWFESDNTAILVPHGRTYKLQGNEDD
jgi:hypothetical protein